METDVPWLKPQKWRIDEKYEIVQGSAWRGKFV